MSDAATLAARLRAVGCVFAEEEAARILALTGDPERIDAVVADRAAGVPLEQALGSAEFAGLEIAVADGVFVPRHRAARIAEVAVARRPKARVAIDLGCGSGALAAVLASRLPAARVIAADVDPSAVAVARGNGTRFGFAVVEGDWWSALPAELTGGVDLAVAYLPHVPTDALRLIPADFRAHEPARTVDGGADGLDPLRAVAADARRWLAPDGVLVTLVADEQRAAAEAIAAEHGLTVQGDDDPEDGHDDDPGDDVVLVLGVAVGRSQPRP